MEMNDLRKEIAIVIISALFMLFLTNRVFFIAYVTTKSMEPTIKAESFVIGYRNGDYKKGDVIAFKRENMILVKRISGVEDEVIKKEGDKINVIPKNSFYVCGDNRENSYDSRYWKDPYVKKNDVIAKIFVKVN
ncbi:MAG: S26 family signal peptidase [Eubacteriaceae bacterium]